MLKQETIKAFMDGEYDTFEKKFEYVKTTDDCYTPVLVYQAVADYVEKTYGIKKENMVRPFYPGGDYQSEYYEPQDVVVDNPPFSILSEIIRFYLENKIGFFLFAPALTLFSSSSNCCCIGVGVSITYENKAKVSTSFVTNLESGIRARSDPELYFAVKKADEDTKRIRNKELQKYSYPSTVLTSSMLSKYSKYGVKFSVLVEESEKISALDAQRKIKKTIFGSGYLISEKAAAEKAAAEKAAAVSFELSKRELAIVDKLSGKNVDFDFLQEETDPAQIRLF